MAEMVTYQARRMTKAEALAEAVNSLFEEIICRSYKERYVGDYFDIAAVGYSGEGAKSLLGSGFRSIVDIDTMDTRVENKIISRRLPSGECFKTVIEQRVWVEPHAEGNTPMGEAFRMARRMLSSWCRKHPASYPPIVINITDGEATDASAEEIVKLAEGIKSCHTEDGGSLLVNIHLAEGDHTCLPALLFPTENDTLPVNRYSRLLYDISSTLPEHPHLTLDKQEQKEPTRRAICYNAPIDELVRLLAIGTRSIEQMI